MGRREELKRWIFCLTLLPFVPLFCLIPLSFAGQEPTVRVAILQEVPEVRVTVEAPCTLTDLKTGASITQWPDLKWQRFQASNPGLQVGNTPVESQAVVLTPVKDAVIRVNAKPYRGQMIFYRTSDGKLTVVNRLDLEEYLVSALASEVNPDWPMEALKAHAVVSRTMIAHRIWISKDKPFDATADTGTHLYYGVHVERERTRTAVEATRGQVLAYEMLPGQRELLPATFHANCGGHTEDASELWVGTGALAPLKGRPDPYCKDRRHYRWNSILPQKDFLWRLGSEVKEIGEFISCQILKRNPSGRVKTVKITGTQNSVILTGRKFRELLGANRLRSLKCNFTTTRDKISFNGFGWGHGVGLCQWGAYGMAREGYKMDEILEFYFPGAQRRKLQGLPGF